ncbi:hypothetical protein IMG5_036100, partial [Ichthyophthirius multifiliis]
VYQLNSLQEFQQVKIKLLQQQDQKKLQQQTDKSYSRYLNKQNLQNHTMCIKGLQNELNIHKNQVLQQKQIPYYSIFQQLNLWIHKYLEVQIYLIQQHKLFQMSLTKNIIHLKANNITHQLIKILGRKQFLQQLKVKLCNKSIQSKYVNMSFIFWKQKKFYFLYFYLNNILYTLFLKKVLKNKEDIQSMALHNSLQTHYYLKHFFMNNKESKFHNKKINKYLHLQIFQQLIKSLFFLLFYLLHIPLSQSLKLKTFGNHSTNTIPIQSIINHYRINYL